MTDESKANFKDAESVGFWADKAGRKWGYKLHWGIVAGRAECVRLELLASDGQPMTAVALREFPIGHLMAKGLRGLTALARWAADAEPGRRAEQLALAKQWEESRAGRSGPKGYGAKHFVKVATIYQREAFLGRKPTQAVAEHFVVSKSAAAKWVARARVMGLLPPARKGKAG